jgi:epoxyqueuosine reductase QueG
MSVIGRVQDFGLSLFDEFTVSSLAKGQTLFIGGLATSSERDLDEFGRVDGRFEMYGYRKHFVPKLQTFCTFLTKHGFDASLGGRYGYPLEGELDLKTLALNSGIGIRGKSTVVLHPKYGTRLRFAAVVSNIPFEDVEKIENKDYNPCQNCTICIDICPVSILKPYELIDIDTCLSNSRQMEYKDDRLIPCDLCLVRCPA